MAPLHAMALWDDDDDDDGTSASWQPPSSMLQVMTGSMSLVIDMDCSLACIQDNSWLEY
jgi:hypothetical protein